MLGTVLLRFMLNRGNFATLVMSARISHMINPSSLPGMLTDIIRPNPEPTLRPLIIGSSTGPEPPFPLQMEGKVIHGYGRGSKNLGIPTANLPVNNKLTPWIADITSGVYFGWASLRFPSSSSSSSDDTTTSTLHSGFSLYPMVMSIMSNQFYNNKERSAEVHVLHEFKEDFYGTEVRVLLTGFIREERWDYADEEELIADIKLDCDVARNSLNREAWALREMGRGTLDGSWLVRETADTGLTL